MLAIIAILAGLSYSPILKQINAAKRVETLKLAQDLALGIEMFQDDLDFLPYDQGQPPTTDQAYSSGGNDPSSHIISHLLGQNASINKRKTNYIDYIPVVDDGEAGLVRANINGNNQGSNATIKGLHDAWGNEYLVIIDYDFDDVVVAPASLGSNGSNGNGNGNNDSVSIDSYAGDTWRGCNIVIISAGPDGNFDKISDLIYNYSL